MPSKIRTLKQNTSSTPSRALPVAANTKADLSSLRRELVSSAGHRSHRSSPQPNSSFPTSSYRSFSLATRSARTSGLVAASRSGSSAPTIARPDVATVAWEPFVVPTQPTPIEEADHGDRPMDRLTLEYLAEKLNKLLSNDQTEVVSGNARATSRSSTLVPSADTEPDLDGSLKNCGTLGSCNSQCEIDSIFEMASESSMRRQPEDAASLRSRSFERPYQMPGMWPRSPSQTPRRDRSPQRDKAYESGANGDVSQPGPGRESDTSAAAAAGRQVRGPMSIANEHGPSATRAEDTSADDGSID